VPAVEADQLVVIREGAGILRKQKFDRRSAGLPPSRGRFGGPL
jgi:hypothetical protein